MKRILAIVAIFAAPQVALADEVFDCTLDPAYSVNDDAEHKVFPISFGSDKPQEWKFALTQSERKLTVNWPSSPMQLNGDGPLIQTGPNSFSSFLISAGPCLFTEGHCGATVHYAKQPNGSLALQILPVALTKFEDGHSEPFVVFIAGRCDARKGKK